MKKWIATLAMLLLLSLAPGQAMAANEYSIQPMQYQAIATFSGAEETFYNQLNQYGKTIYDQMEAAIKNGNKTFDLNWPDPLTFMVTASNSSQSAYEEAVQNNATYKANTANFTNNYQLAIDALQCDHPEYFWFDASESTVKLPYSGKMISTNTYSVTMGFQFSIAVKTCYTDYADQYVLLVNKIKNADVEKSNRKDTVKAIHDYLCGMITYTTTGQYVFDAGGAFLYGQAVCQGYAHAFKLMCNYYGIPCVLVAGTGNTTSGNSEDHMWNMVQMENGYWYGVDVTWDDQSTIMYDFFLVGSDTKAPHFGNRAFSVSHVAKGNFTENYGDFSFTYPTMSTEAYAKNANETAPPTAVPSVTPKVTASPKVTNPSTSTPKPGETGGVVFENTGTPLPIGGTTATPVPLPSPDMTYVPGKAGLYLHHADGSYSLISNFDKFADGQTTVYYKGTDSNTFVPGTAVVENSMLVFTGEDGTIITMEMENLQGSATPVPTNDGQPKDKTYLYVIIGAAAVLAFAVILFILLHSRGVKRREKIEKTDIPPEDEQ